MIDSAMEHKEQALSRARSLVHSRPDRIVVSLVNSFRNFRNEFN